MDGKSNAYQLAACALAAGFFYLSSLAIYRLFFHPLAKIPGPRLAAICDLWWAKHWVSGHWAHDLEKAHAKYGPVVRIRPMELSFASTQAQQDIYGHPKPGRKPFLKSDFYEKSDGAAQSIASMQDPEQHRQARKALSPAFSAKALRDQQDVVLKYVNMFVDQVRSLGDTAEGIDINEWYIWITFDTIGDLAFGDSFGSVENAKPHFWVAVLLSSMKAITWMLVFRRIPSSKILAPILLFNNRNILKDHKQHAKLTKDLVKSRMSKPNNRDDFFSHLLRDKSSVATEKLFNAHASSLIIAGSETSSTLLSGVTYHLLKNPDKMTILQEEIRDAFKDPADIDADSTAKLPYLFAVLEEGLRICPPVPFGLSRNSPGATVDGIYVPQGAIVSTHNHTISRSPNFFHSPMTFAPERWLPTDHPLYNPRYANDDKDASKPFSLGSRVCIGINLAYMELRIILAKMVYHFDWELVKGPEGTERAWDRDCRQYTLWDKPSLKVRYKDVHGKIKV